MTNSFWEHFVHRGIEQPEHVKLQGNSFGNIKNSGEDVEQRGKTLSSSNIQFLG
jgi:phosphotransferase system IIA component